MNHTITRRRAGAGVAVGALVGSALLFAPSANAATVTDVREIQIAATGEPFSAGYHLEGGGTPKVVNGGLELAAGSGFVRGYTNNTGENLGTTNENADLDKLGDSAFVASGAHVIKVAVYSDNIATTDDKLTTLAQAGSGTWTTTAAIGTAPAGINAGDTKPTAEIVEALKPNYRVKGFGVFNTSETTSTVSSLTFADVTYQFRNNAPVVADRTVSTKVNTAVAVPLTAIDIDGNELTYTVDAVAGGAVTGTGAAQTFTPAKNFKGNGSVKYTVADGRGGSATATITVKVDKSKGKVDIYRVHPVKASVRSTVYVYASISTDGAKAKQGTTVRVYAKSKLVGTSKVNGSGKVKVKLPNRLPAGNATLKVTQVGSSTLNGDSDSVKIKVRK